MKKLIAISLLFLQVSAFQMSTACASQLPARKNVQRVQTTNWDQTKTALLYFTYSFMDRSLTDAAKVNFFPALNEVLSNMQDLKLSESENQERISIVARLIGATLKYDFSSSNLDTIYFDYQKNKKLYRLEFNSLPVKTRDEILSTLRDMETGAAGDTQEFS